VYRLFLWEIVFANICYVNKNVLLRVLLSSELGRQISKIYTQKVTKLSFDNPAFKGNGSFSKGKIPVDEWKKGELDWVWVSASPELSNANGTAQ